MDYAFYYLFLLEFLQNAIQTGIIGQEYLVSVAIKAVLQNIRRLKNITKSIQQHAFIASHVVGIRGI